MRELVSLREVARSFGATRALRSVSFDLRPGEVHALVGENGAGKSTLMNILSGVLQPDFGTVLIDGEAVHFTSPLDAQATGIATVFQELSLIPGLTAAENICARHAPTRHGLIDRTALRTRASQALGRLGLAIPPDTRVETLLASQRQGVEIAKALDLLFHPESRARVRVLVLDEPTSALNAGEKQALFAAVRALRAEGVGIVYISHHLEEVTALADRVTVLRDGATVWTRPAAGMTRDDIVRAMVGRNIQRQDRARGTMGPIAARFRGAGRRGHVAPLSFELHAGEVLAVAGLEGAGREMVARLLAGIERIDTGMIELGGTEHPGNLHGALARGLAFVPDDRKSLGLFLDMSVASNVLAADLASVSRAGLVRDSRLRDQADEAIRRHGIRVSDGRTPVGTLSGGNQQKVLLAKWLRRNPRVLVVEEPTKGVDIGAKQDIHDEILALARRGTAVLVASSDLPEVLELADRTLVMHGGRLAGTLSRAEATEEAIMALAA